MERSVDEMIDFFLSEKGEAIQLNGIDEVALIQDATDKINLYDEKIVRTKVELKTGDYIDSQGSRYLIMSQIDKNPNSYRGRMRPCNYKLAFNWNGNIKWFDAIVEGKSFSIDTGTYMSLPDGTIFVYLQENADTRDISLGQRFYTTHQPFAVQGIDHSMNGMIKISAKLDAITTYDDVANNIADRWKYETTHTYTLTIDNGTSANVLLNDVMQLNCTVTDNGAIVANPNITYISCDPNVVSVDNTGKVMGINPGQSTITAKLTYHDEISDSIDLTTVEQVTHQYSITITGNATLKLGQSTSYVAKFYDNGVEVFDKSGVWSVRNQDGTTPVMATITASTGNSVTIKAGSTSTYVNKYIVLTCTLADDSTIKVEKTIQIKSLI